MSIFIDTNVLMDLFTKREPFYRNAEIIFSHAEAGTIQIGVSALTIATANYLVAKNIGAKPTRLLLNRFTQLVSIVALDHRILDRALSDPSFPDAEDAMQYYSALRYDASLIITRNTKDFRAASIPVVTPGQYLNALS